MILRVVESGHNVVDHIAVSATPKMPKYDFRPAVAACSQGIAVARQRATGYKNNSQYRNDRKR
jgi:GTP:adenosylcobinamide-phosphate guanylyltransferase